jgi:hypothetical protein
MNALELFRSGHCYHSIAAALGTTEAVIERVIHRLRADERIAARCESSRRTEDASAKWQRTKTQNAEIRRRRA